MRQRSSDVEAAARPAGQGRRIPPSVVLLASVGLVLSVAACRARPPEQGLNAQLGAPGECGVGQRVVLDARDSRAGAASGAIVEYAFFFGDGSPVERTLEPQVTHVYLTAGSFQVAVRVTDDEGRSARDTARIELSTDGPEGPCFPEEDTGEGEPLRPQCVSGESMECGLDAGACQAGEARCDEFGLFGECVGAIGPIEEECGNGVDDDCDGVVDEGCQPCDDGEARPCGSDVGECAPGTQICGQGVYGPCQGGRGPRDEICDGLDNDCDGAVDQELSCACEHGDVQRCGEAEGECRQGEQTCTDGAWSDCAGAVGPAEERCDGLDNDCNGIVDEGCACELGDSRQCGTDVGACRSGIQVCEEGGWGVCLGARPATPEVCDGVDNDCDGDPDEGCACEEGASRTCGSDTGECVSGVQVCRGGAWGGCVGAVAPTAEDCDERDNDCNGVIDDLCPCRAGETRPCGPSEGDCEPGTQACTEGSWGECTGVTLPGDEVCDTRDNDCDGEVDEALVQRCETRCGGGVEACRDGVFGECTAPAVEDEVCDGQDNDCDGAFDEALARDCSNACGSGEESCVGGRFQTCDAPAPELEECDGRDNDCNGAVDDGLAAPNCPLQLGVCAGSERPCRGRVGFGDCGPGTYGEGYERAERSCDGLDNDCDGAVDEGCACREGQSRACGSGIGACEAGVQRCGDAGVWGDCDGQTAPVDEQCDGQDNDCDGAVDEDLILDCSTACGAGVQVCEDGRFLACDAPPPGPEECDGLDNDCDGDVDEGCFCVPGEAQACGSNVGQCRAGFQVCLGANWSGCNGETGPSPEGCDGLDNDCDGFVDEGCQCQGGERQACGVDVGECRSGEQACTDAGAWTGCEGAVGPVEEECDGLDNDCDGLLDELCPCRPGDRRVCGIDVGACRQGTQICILGRWGPCFGEQGPAPEECDGIDNDCDEAIDEICECQAGERRQCGVDTGECRRGSQTCRDDGTFGRCRGSVDPQPEVCDGLDNDCNGQVDEDCVCRDGEARPCGVDVGVCQRGTQICVAGVFGACEGQVTPVAEECDGQDNDCDGQVDEDVDCDCVDGATQRCGSDVGACSAGVQVCARGRWGVCEGAVGPSPEQCDDVDHDCDEVPDNGLDCECVNEQVRPCGTDVGACVAGAETCLAGAWSACVGSVAPREERCDGADDDCDGAVDEDCECAPGDAQACGFDPVGACVAGQQVCGRNGRWGACTGGAGPNPEICGNGVDDDCNGAVDETCECEPGAERSCGTDVGTCTAGVQRCPAGSWLPACEGETGPSIEACDGLDNDCDGEIDPDCECVDDASQACGSDVGACQAGIQRCVGGRFGPCEGEQGPTQEVCDGLDNDCDGSVDDAAAGGQDCECRLGEVRPCGTDEGSCVAGTQACGEDGLWADCSGGVGPAPESCSPAGADEDCDGDVDEDCGECNPGATRACGTDEGACQRGLETCSADGAFGACEGGVSPEAEACNAVDDDCDGRIDEGCDCMHGEDTACGSDIGRCAAGSAECLFGILGPCEGGRGPEPEQCNDEDDDCDGAIDEDCECLDGASQSCGTDVGACASGNQVCFDGGWGQCLGASEGGPEACDGLDNDCDGIIDNGCGCRDGMSRQCGSDIGECVAGTQLCAGGGWQACVGAVDPEPEVCGDGLDNDCDGNPDTGCECEPFDVRACGSDVGACEPGVQMCSRFGSWSNCANGVPPAFEVCDGLDNDCDGVTDNGCDCEDGTFRVCGSDVGACETGRERCTNGSFGECNNSVGPEPDACDGVDNDCDGLTDEGCPCQIGETRECGSDLGACQKGLQICGARGGFGPCMGGVDPSEEVCDGLDNDCDGEVDNDEDGGLVLCGTDVGDCEAVDGFLRRDAQTCVFRAHSPGVRICDDRGLCPPPTCEEFEEEVVAECAECMQLVGCEDDEEGACEPAPAGTACGAGGQCDGEGLCDDVGCADGEREGFVDRARFPGIASCVADWAGTSNMRAGGTGQPCGDDLADCARPADACMTGWHVCMDNGDPEDLSSRVEGADCNSALAGQGVFAAASSHCSSANGCAYEVPLPCTANGVCSEAVCCGTGCGAGACLDGVFEGDTGIAPRSGRGCGRMGNNTDGVLCCKD